MVVLAHDAGALPDETLRTLDDLCVQLAIPINVVRHKSTFSAAETQAVLPEKCLVQKTVTGRAANKIVLWTGVGDYRVTRPLRKMANRQIGVAAARDHILNPSDVDALTFYGMQPGMVSPFLISRTPAAHELAAMFVLDWRRTHDLSASVAISLSLTESLVVPLKHLDALLCAYAKTVYAHLPFFAVNTEGMI